MPPCCTNQRSKHRFFFFLPDSVQANLKVFEQQKELKCSSDASLLGWAGSVPQGSSEDLGCRGPLPSPAKSRLPPGQLSWLPRWGHDAQVGTVPGLP